MADTDEVVCLTPVTTATSSIPNGHLSKKNIVWAGTAPTTLDSSTSEATTSSTTTSTAISDATLMQMLTTPIVLRPLGSGRVFAAVTPSTNGELQGPGPSSKTEGTGRSPEDVQQQQQKLAFQRTSGGSGSFVVVPKAITSATGSSPSKPELNRPMENGHSSTLNLPSSSSSSSSSSSATATSTTASPSTSSTTHHPIQNLSTEEFMRRLNTLTEQQRHQRLMQRQRQKMQLRQQEWQAQRRRWRAEQQQQQQQRATFTLQQRINSNSSSLNQNSSNLRLTQRYPLHPPPVPTPSPPPPPQQQQPPPIPETFSETGSSTRLLTPAEMNRLREYKEYHAERKRREAALRSRQQVLAKQRRLAAIEAAAKRQLEQGQEPEQQQEQEKVFMTVDGELVEVVEVIEEEEEEELEGSGEPLPVEVVLEEEVGDGDEGDEVQELPTPSPQPQRKRSLTSGMPADLPPIRTKLHIRNQQQQQSLLRPPPTLHEILMAKSSPSTSTSTNEQDKEWHERKKHLIDRVMLRDTPGQTVSNFFIKFLRIL